MKSGLKNSNKAFILLIILLIILLLLTMLLSFNFGRYSGARALDVIKIFLNQIFGDGIIKQTWSSSAEVVVLRIRLPRILAAALVGAALPMAGASYQALFSNPMASPDTLGVSNGASVGAVIAILLSATPFMVEISAFVVGVVAVLFVYLISLFISKGKNLTLYLVLVGMVVSSLLSAIISILKYCCDPENQLPAITYWLMGSFNGMTLQDVGMYSVFFLIGTIPLFLLRWRMNILSLSDIEARSLGENTNLIRTITILCATLLTAASIAITGGIGWVGLIIPHIARILVGNDFRKVLPVSALLGSIFLLLMDNIARSIISSEIPIGILTSIIGAPIFFIVLIKYRRNMLSEN